MSINLQPITDLDWEGLCGAESWPDGSRPLLAEGAFEDGTGWLLVFDPNAAFLMVVDGTPDGLTYLRDTTFKDHEAVFRFVKDDLEFHSCSFDFRLAGFKPI